MLQKTIAQFILISFFSCVTKVIAQNYVLDSIIHQHIKNHYTEKHFALLQNDIQNLNIIQHKLDAQMLYYSIIANLELANITDTQCVFYQKAKSDIQQYIQLSMSFKDDIHKEQTEYIKIIQFNIFKEGFLYDLYSKMETYKNAIQAFNNKNNKTAYKNLELAIELENPYAMLLMGDVYASNNFEDEENSMENALNYYEMAAENKLAIAIPLLINHLKKTHDNFLDVLKEYEAILDFGVSMYEPYSMLYKGKLIVEKHKNKPINTETIYAYQLINKAATYAIQDAYSEMIWMHCKGIGTFQSQNEAYYWLDKIKAIPNISNATITSFEECIKK